ncbi:MAG: ribonuclease III [Planctomycetes bacterium]|nr:ribonuclease III [Planctomycetota bacterium]
MHDLDPDIQRRAEEIVGHTFANPAILSEALTHASVAEHRVQSNERMEFFGDAILGAVTCEYLFHNYPEYLEGELTKIKSAVVSRKVCAMIADQLGLTELLKLGKGMCGRDQLPASLAAAVYESMVAAIYLDGGFEPVRRFILEHMQPIIAETAASTHQQNFKSVLQQHAQKHLSELPSYILLDEKGPDHSKCFQVCAQISGRRYPAAWGSNKKEAEQQAALLALAELGVVVIGEDGTATVQDPAPAG